MTLVKTLDSLSRELGLPIATFVQVGDVNLFSYGSDKSDKEFFNSKEIINQGNFFI